MIDPKHIPHLIKLLDDDSVEIRERVRNELSAFGPILKRELKEINFPLSPIQKEYLKSIHHDHKKIWLRRVWPSWFQLSSDRQKLERSLCILSEYLDEGNAKPKLKSLLDDLSLQYKRRHITESPLKLAKFLFKEQGFKGNEKDYYNPQNSNLAYVIKEKKGIPISLASIYMLTGARLGLDIQGCHFPGHFLASFSHNGKRVFVDCFSGGQLIEEKDITHIKEGVFDGIDEILRERAGVESIIKRFLANLIRAFEIVEDEGNSYLMVDLFKDLDRRLLKKRAFDITPEEIIATRMPVFKQGQIVRHRRYGYRGIIVDIDDECDADDSWYYGNQTQPSREQPWYHVLVHGSDQVTYAAESNLIIDDSKEEIDHPLLSYFFNQSVDGQYVRNDNPWPDEEEE